MSLKEQARSVATGSNSAENELKSDTGYKWLVLAVVSLGQAMSALDTSSVNLSYPELTRFFNVPLTTISWVSLAYLLVSSATLTTFGRLADLFGRKRIYVGGLIIFCLGSGLCSLAPTAWFLIAARMVEAIGVAMALSNGIALIGEVFPALQRGMAIGVLETAVALALTLGPTIAGFVIGSFGWQGIFLVNLPIGLINITLSIVLLKETRLHLTRPNLDLLGTLSFGGAIALLLLVLTQGQEQGWLSFFSLGLLGLSLALFTAFIVREKTVQDPAIDLNLFFANRRFASAIGIKVLGYATFFAINFMLPFYLTQILRLDARTTGLALIPYTAAMGFGSLFTSFIADRLPTRRLTGLGLGLMAGGCLGLSFITPEAGYISLAMLMAVSGIGMGLFITPNDKAIVNAAPRDRLGTAASTLALARSLGMISGIALAGTLYALATGNKPGLTNSEPLGLLQGFHLVFYAALGLALLGVTLVAVLQKS